MLMRPNKYMTWMTACAGLQCCGAAVRQACSDAVLSALCRNAAAIGLMQPILPEPSASPHPTPLSGAGPGGARAWVAGGVPLGCCLRLGGRRIPLTWLLRWQDPCV